MAMNRVQFQKVLSLPDFMQRSGTEEQCATASESALWLDEFHCPQCYETQYSVLKCSSRKTFQRNHCRHQTSLITGTLLKEPVLTMPLSFGNMRNNVISSL
ncbi:transposase [Acidithiobacillus thiooxidans]|uniref:Transposase n=2 Tax=Acidithiobacillaceae TaxID=225058 RepID=A0ABS6A084_9PROT|nr:transposase [Acidithiobacillus sulfurivorans]MBU2837836.1 transposase [Acidithiobacillus thiooxidans]